MVKKMLKYAKNLIYHHLVSTFWKNKETILSALENKLTTNKKIRKCDLGNVDQALLEWFKEQRNVAFPILKVQAEIFAKQLWHKNFACNNAWLDRFKKWHNIVYAKFSGEAVSVDLKTASEWVKSAWVECQQGYSEEDIYNADETGVFYNIVTYQGSPVTRQLNGASLLYSLISATMKTNAS
jgi:hypothetical protein